MTKMEDETNKMCNETNTNFQHKHVKKTVANTTIINSKMKSIDIPGKQDTTEQIKQEHIPCIYFWSGASGIVFALVNSCFIFCAWPQHHIFTEPNFWHEFMTTAAVGFIGLFSASFILNCEIWMNIKSIKSWKNFIILYFISALSWILANAGYYYIYSIILKLSPPMPLNIHVCGILTLIAALSSLWLLIPAQLRSSNMFWRRYAYYVLAQIFRYVAVLEYFVLSWLFVVIYEEYQFIIAIMLPVIRDINGRVLAEVCYKAAGTKTAEIKVTCIHEMGCRHAVFLSVAISLLATKKTAALALGLDVAVNFLICIKIIWRTQTQKDVIAIEDDVELQVLALKEKIVPCVVPLSYCICLMVAYFGPNAGIIGNVGNTSWHFGKVENLGQPLHIMGILFLVHLISIVLWSVLLKKFCKITYLDGYMYIQKKFWLIMAIHEAYALNEVRNLNIWFSTMLGFKFNNYYVITECK